MSAQSLTLYCEYHYQQPQQQQQEHERTGTVGLLIVPRCHEAFLPVKTWGMAACLQTGEALTFPAGSSHAAIVRVTKAAHSALL